MSSASVRLVSGYFHVLGEYSIILIIDITLY